MATVLLEKLTRSSSLLSSKDHLLDATAKWDSLKTYVLLAFSLSACNLNYDTYSQLVTPVIFIEMFGFQLTIGSSYAFMDFFIRQYTGLLDFNATLNPILRSINYAIILQNCFWLIVYAVETTESLKTTVIVLKSKIPDWYHCPPGVSKCKDIWDLFGTCRKFNITNISDTSIHYYYMSEIQENKQQTERLVLLAIIWLVVFFVSSAASFTVIKFVKFTSFMKIVCIIINFVIMVVMKNQLFGRAVSDIMSMNAQSTMAQSMNHVASIYCIGLIGVYDFGTMTPYTTIDNAVILYSCVFATLSMMVSITCRMMYLNAKRCFRLSNNQMKRLYAIYAIYPLTMDFLHVQKLVALIMFVNLTLGGIGHLVYTTACTSRMLASNYRRVKEMYLCGVLCFIGFLTSFWLHSDHRPVLSGVKRSSVAMGYFLGALKSAIVMWAYGVKRFSTDINFWLGFKPTIYWRCCWVLLPIPLCYSTYACIVDVVIRRNQLKGNPFRAYIVWMSVTLTVLTLVQIKTITNFVFKNNLLGAFRCSAKYGPPDRVTRKRRRKFHEELNLELCDHECNMVDDSFDCMHEVYEETEHELKTIIELDEDNVESSDSSLVE